MWRHWVTATAISLQSPVIFGKWFIAWPPNWQSDNLVTGSRTHTPTPTYTHTRTDTHRKKKRKKQVLHAVGSYLCLWFWYYSRGLLHSLLPQTHTAGWAETLQSPAQPGNSGARHTHTHTEWLISVCEVLRKLVEQEDVFSDRATRRGSVATRQQGGKHWRFQAVWKQSTVCHRFYDKTGLIWLWKLVTVTGVTKLKAT